MNCSKDIVVNGTRFENGTYTVTVNKSAVGKIISDPNLSAEKISVLDNIEDVVGNANYVGSGEYVSHGSKNKSDVSRYDYFETEVSINGKEYIVSFDVEVHPNVNNYRTHKVINEINLTSSPDMGPLPTADNLISTNTGDSSSLFNNSIPNSGENVNEAAKNVQYNSNKIDGFEDLNKDLDRLIGMYKGNENTQTLYEQMKSAVNEYIQTYNKDAAQRAIVLAASIDESLVGHSYTRKGSGKSSAKSQNNRVTTTFSEGEFVDTLLSYNRSLTDTARSNSESKNQTINPESVMTSYFDATA